MGWVENSEFLELSGELFGELTPELVIARVNSRWTSALGYTRGELEGRSLLEFLAPEERVAVGQCAEIRGAGDPGFAGPLRFASKEGASLFLDCRIRPSRTGHRLLFAGRDVTVEHRNERLLLLKEQVSGIGSWEIDLVSKELYWSRQTHLIHGTDPESYKPRLEDGLSFFAPESLPRLQQAVERLVNDGTAYDLVLRFIDARGRKLWVRARSEAEMRDGRVVRCMGTFQDLTAEVEREQALAAQNERQEHILEGTGLGAWDWWLADNRVQFDRRWCEMLGLDPGAVRHELATWDGLVHPDDRAQAYADIREHLEGRTPFYENAHRLRHAQGHWVWILDRGRVSERDGEGRPVRFTGTHLNITRIKELEAEADRYRVQLERQQEQLAAFVEHTPMATAMLDREMRYLAASRRWVEDYGLEDVPLIGRSHYEIFPGLSEEWKAFHRDGLAGIGSKRLEDHFADREGRPYWLRWEIVPWYQVDGQVGGIMMLTENITARKEAEVAVALARREIDRFFEVSLDLLCVAGADGYFKRVNPAFTRLLGYPADELLARPVTDFIHPEDVAATRAELERLSRGEEIIRFENRYVCRDGSLRVLSWKGSPDPESGLCYAAARDVTQERAAEKKLIQASKMASLGEMAGGVAHEINNPLSIIKAWVDTMRLQAARGQLDSAALDSGLTRISQTSERIARIVAGLRAFSRNSDRDPMKAVPIERIVEDTLELCRERFRLQGIELRVATIPEALSLECRAPQLGQVLMNLLSNAFDAVSRLEERWVEIAVEVVGERVVLTVTDSGRGIEPAVIERMMQPFYTTKEVGSGTGLGLSISKGLVEDHGGSLSYDASSPRTRFRVELPLRQNSRV